MKPPEISEDLVSALSKLADQPVSAEDIAEVLTNPTGNAEAFTRIGTALVVGGFPWLGAAIIANRTLNQVFRYGIPVSAPAEQRLVVVEALESAAQLMRSSLMMEAIALEESDQTVENTVTNPSQGGTPEQSNTEEQV